MANAEMQKGHINWVEDMTTARSILDTDTDFLLGRVVCRVDANSTEVTTVGINGGAARLALGGDNSDTGQFYGPLAFEPDESITVGMQVRLRTSSITIDAIYVGWTDRNDASEVPIHDENGTLVTTATDAMGVMLEGEQDATWQTVGVQGGTDKAQAASTNISDLVVDTFTTVKLEVNPADTGTMFVEVDGVELATANTTLTRPTGNNVTTAFFDSSIVFAPVISGDDRGTSYNLDVAEFGWWGNVGSTFD